MVKTIKQKIILASTSPRRKELATEMGLEFEIIPSDYEEDMTKKLSPKKMVTTFSYGKAEDVAKRLTEGIVIGVDTIVVFKGKKIGKPKSAEQAIQMLQSFSGKWQSVYSGVAVIDAKTKKFVVDYEITKVKFRKLDLAEIKAYVATGDALDKAGAYGIQGLSSIFFEKVDGCYTNVIGFPSYCVYRNLKKMGVNIFAYDKWKSNN